MIILRRKLMLLIYEFPITLYKFFYHRETVVQRKVMLITPILSQSFVQNLMGSIV